MREDVKKKKVTSGTLENRITGWRRAIIAVGREPETSQGFVTAVAPTYLPNDRAFGMKRTKRLCNTCFCWYSYIYTHRETSRFFKPTVLPRKLIPNTFLLGCIRIIVLSIGSTKRRAFVAVIPSKRSMETTSGPELVCRSVIQSFIAFDSDYARQCISAKNGLSF